MSRPAPLRIGILGAARIARQYAAAVKGCLDVEMVAVASRSESTAAAFAADCGIPAWHGSYEALLADPAIDIVYLPLPNHLHAAWAIAAARAGKHVLCEKPLAMGLQEAQAMFEAARQHGVMLLEAFPWYFQPQTRDLLAVLHGGEVGEVRTVQAAFGFTLQNTLTDIRIRPETGGGALLDAGSYPLSLIRLVMGEAPLHVTAWSNWADTGVDISTQATLHYANGRSAQLSCAMNVATHRRATIMCTSGTIETEYLNHTASEPGGPSGYMPSQLRVRRGIVNVAPYQEIRSATGSGFRFCAEAFAGVINARDYAAVDRAAAASLDNAATLEAIARSARLGQTIALPPAGEEKP